MSCRTQNGQQGRLATLDAALEIIGTQGLQPSPCPGCAE